MSRKIGIFYLSRKPGPDRVLIYANGHWNLSPYIRMQVVEGDDLSNALDAAKPRPDEAVMNTHFLDPWEGS